jgi:hypothetical protein
MCDEIEKNKKLESLSLLSSYICGEYQSFWLKNQGRDRFWNMEIVPCYRHGTRSVRPKKKFVSLIFEIKVGSTILYVQNYWDIFQTNIHDGFAKKQNFLAIKILNLFILSDLTI